MKKKMPFIRIAGLQGLDQDPGYAEKYEPTVRLSMPSDKLLIMSRKIYFLFE